MNHFPALEAGRTALVVVDMQTAFVADGAVFGNAHARDIVPTVNALVRAARAASGRRWRS